MLTMLLMTSTSLLASPQGTQFDAPVRLKAGGEYVKVENPGYAAPCWADLDGDGRKDLIVGQFRDGKLLVAKNTGEGELADGRLAKADWLEAEGETAEVPGVW